MWSPASRTSEPGFQSCFRERPKTYGRSTKTGGLLTEEKMRIAKSLCISIEFPPHKEKRAIRMMCWSAGGSFTPEKFAEKSIWKVEPVEIAIGILLKFKAGPPASDWPLPTCHFSSGWCSPPSTPSVSQTLQITPVNYFSTSESSHTPLSSTESYTHASSHIKLTFYLPPKPQLLLLNASANQ